MAHVIFQRLISRVFFFPETESQQVLILLIGHAPEIAVGSQEALLLAFLQGTVAEQMLLPDLGEVVRRNPGRNSRDNVVDIGEIMEIRIALSSFPVQYFSTLIVGLSRIQMLAASLFCSHEQSPAS